MNTQKQFLLLVACALASSLYGDLALAGKKNKAGCGDRAKKCCARLPQPPTDTLVSLEGENCICCFENRELPFKTDFNDNKICQSYDKLCASLCTPFNYPLIPAPPTYTPNPAIDVPSCQKVVFPPAVSNPLNIRGKNVLIIGGSKGIGKVIAERLSDPAVGCNVIATSRHPECYAKPTGYLLKKVDVGLEDDVKEFIALAVGQCFNGRLDILVNCAGIYWAGPFAEATGDDLLNILNNNTVGYHRVTHYALPYMRHNNETRVISFGSLVAYLVSPYFGGYAISKIALQKWNDSMQMEEMFGKAQGFVTFGPTFSLMEPTALLTTIGLYEWFQAKELTAENPLVKGPHQAIAGLQNTTLFGALSPELAAEAVFRVAVARQPGVRYTVATEGDPFFSVIQAANTLSQDEAINQIWSPFVTAVINALPEAQVLLGEAYCQGCSTSNVPASLDLKAGVMQKLQTIVAAARKAAGSECAYAKAGK